MSPDFLAMTLIFRKIEEVRIRLHADLKDLLCVNQLPNLRSGKAKSLICFLVSIIYTFDSNMRLED